MDILIVILVGFIGIIIILSTPERFIIPIGFIVASVITIFLLLFDSYRNNNEELNYPVYEEHDGIYVEITKQNS